MKYILSYIILSVSVYFLVSYEKDDKIDSYLNSKTKTYSNAYNTLYNEYKTIANLIFEANINTEEVKSIFAKATLSTEKEKDEARKALYKYLKLKYTVLKKINIKQLHFHLPNNDSFLRFHRPQKYGDNLTSIRQTVEYVNRLKKPVDSFEEGRIYNGYRFVFPIFKTSRYLGSVEVSFNTLRLNEDFKLNYNVSSLFLILKDVVDKKVFDDEHSNYVSSGVEKFYIEKKNINTTNVKNTMSDKTINILNERSKDLNSFSLYDEKIDKVVTLIKVSNTIDGTVVGIFLIHSNANYIHNKSNNFYVILFLINILILIILYFIYTRSKYEEKIYKKNQDLEAKQTEILSFNKDLEKRVEEKTKELKKSLKIFGENVIASGADLKGNITYASPALCDISGYKKEELIGCGHNIFRHKDMPSKVYKDLWDTIKSGKVWNGELKNKKKNGEVYWVNASIMPEFDAQNNIIRYSSIRVEITAQKAKEEFMANMSHELRTPLNAIIGFSSILNKKQIDLHNKELSSQIYTSAKSLLNLINDILDLAKIENANFTIEAFNFNLFDELVEFSQQFEGLTHKKLLNFKTTLDDSLKGIFHGDWGRINQIALNLISNAVKFTPKDGTIGFSGDYKNGIFMMSVSDTGIGMNQEVQDKIFKPFEQADGSTTRKYGGTGLGLSITQNLVELMDGKIELESSEGKGTSFKVSIPLKKLDKEVLEDHQSQLSEVEKDDSLSGHILIAEDNKTNQMLIGMLIEDFGLSCDLANDGLEAVNMYDPNIHKLILMDENMPNMNGLEAMRIIQEKHEEKCGAIIALTANAMAGDKERFLEAGMDAYLAKPIDEDVLYNTLVKFL